MKASVMLTTFLLGFGFALLSDLKAAEPTPGSQVEQKWTAKDSGEVPYLLYLPAGYQVGKEKLPLMLFLHGRGESDGPLNVVAKWGLPLLASHGESFPFILVSPQCPKEDSWSSPTQQARLVELLDTLVEKYQADTNRIYISGLSMGGSGSWKMASSHPKKFAAVIPICGRGDMAEASAMKDLPIWAFVGDQDRAFQANVDLVEAIKKAGSTRVRLTTLENIGHNSWSAAFASPDLYAWLGKQTR